MPPVSKLSFPASVLGIKSVKNSSSESDMALPGSKPDTTYIQSSFKKLRKVASRNVVVTPYNWLDDKRRGDAIGDYWRVHDKLYDLTNFIEKHPGGRDWIDVTRGTDVTEAFESSHILNMNKVESILAKYYVKEATHPRNSPYEFKDDGFYKTLKRRVEPILKKVGTGPTKRLLLTQDLLASLYVFTSCLGAWSGSWLLQILAGIILGMVVVGAHNFLHLKDTWRRFYFDLCPMTSFEFRITHGLSHHLFPNTILDYEVIALQPIFELLPSRPKNLLNRYGSLIYSHFVYSQIMGQDILRRVLAIYSGQAKIRPENFLIFIQLAIFIFLSSSLINGTLCWLIIYSAASYWLAIVGFHDGDEARHDPDFGLCQLDSTLDKADDFHKTELAVLTTFGEHPLHHLFPSVCHSKLPLLKPIFEQVLHEFLENNRYASQLELFIGTHRQYARVTKWSRKRQLGYQFGEY
ncbi:Cytochrome b5-related protein [Folsomia candida]|uniref:Cytochrome b5-related protein n=1 Tax=Folsomia candida TaxID=158441 RepID=A0A226DR33_FOLCA|nr:Cytochrome b5-related protein [Folsomia candida]